MHQTIVGNETTARCFGQARFYHGVTTLPDFYAGLFGKLRCAPIECGGTFGEGAQRIQLRHGLRQLGEHLNVVLQLVEQKLVQIFFTRQCTLLCRQGFVFERFELGCDETLCVFQSLPASVVVWHFVNLTLRHFDVKAMHLVELDTQIGNARACFFTGFQFEQKVVAIGLNGAKFVQLCI